MPTRCRLVPSPSILRIPPTLPVCRSRCTAILWTTSRTPEADSSTRCSSSSCAVGGTASRSTLPTRSPTPTVMPQIPATAASDPYSSIPTTSKKTASRPQRRQAPRRRQRDVGHSGGSWPTARRSTWRAGPTHLFGGWTVSSIFQARSGQNLTPFFTGFYTTSPCKTGKPLDGLGTCFCELLAP